MATSILDSLTPIGSSPSNGAAAAPSAQPEYTDVIDVGGPRNAPKGEPGSQFIKTGQTSGDNTPDMAPPKSAPDTGKQSATSILDSLTPLTPAPTDTPTDTAQPSWRGIAKNLAAGATDVGANIVNTAADPFGNLIGKPLATAAVFAHDLIAPMVGGQHFDDQTRQMLLGDNVPQPGQQMNTAIAHTIGAQDPATLQANSNAEELARQITGAAGSAVALSPSGIAMPAALGGASAIGGNLAGQAAPDWAKPMAELAGGAAAVPVGLGAMKVAGRVANTAATAGGNYGIGPKQSVNGVPATNSQINEAAGYVGHALGESGQAQLDQFGKIEAQARDLEQQLSQPGISQADRVQAQRQLNALQPQREQLVQGLKPTVAQLVPNQETVALNRNMATTNNAQFAARDQANNAAMTGAIQGVAPSGVGPEATANMFMRQLNRHEAQQAADVANARAGVTGKTGALGGEDTPREYGRQIREAREAAYAPVDAASKQLWAKVDPEGQWALSAAPVRAATAQILSEKSASTATSADENRIMRVAAKLGSAVTFKELSDLRSDIGDATRQLVKEPKYAKAVRRLTMLKHSIDQAISESVAHIAGEDSGVASRIAEFDQGDTNGEPQSGAASGSRVIARPASGQGSVRGAAGNGNAASGGHGGAKSNSVLASAGSNRRAESLHDWLISKGGVRDQSGELTASDLHLIHHRAGGRLVNNTSGMYQDYAREGAVEEGFLRPNADINDLLNALQSKNPVYRIDEAADQMLREKAEREGRITEEKRDDARDRVATALDHAGVRATPGLVDHAADLVMQGVAIEDALRQAAYAQTVAPEVRAGQANRPADALTPNVTAENAAEYQAAVASTKAKYERFGQGGVGRIAQRGGNEDFKIGEGDVPRQIFTRGPSEPQEVERFARAVGGPDQAAAIGQNVLVNELRERGIIRPDGMVDAGKFPGWLRQRGATINQFPGLAQKFADAQTAQVTFDRTRAAHEEALRDFQNGAAKHFLNADPQVAVDRIFTSGNAAGAARQLYDAVKGDPDALAGLQRGVVTRWERKFNIDEDPGAEGSTIKSKAFRDELDKYRNAIKIIFGGQGLQTIEQVEAGLNRAAAAKQMEATAGSNTVQKALGAKAHSAIGAGAGATVMTLIFEQMGEHAASLLGGHGMLGLLGSAGGAGIGYWLHSLKQGAIETRTALIREMMLNPDLARVMMQRLKDNEALSKIAQQKIGAAIQGAILANNERKTQ